MNGIYSSDSESGGSQEKTPEAETDDFWAIEDLIPRKANGKTQKISRPSSESIIETTEIEFDPPAKESEPRERGASIPVLKEIPQARELAAKRCTEPTEKIRADEVYRPDHPLIREVRIYRWRSTFRFYERFCQTAEYLFDQNGSPCAPVDFFSYMPQYDQMNRAQLSWYLYWRDGVRRGEYFKTDYSYIFLLIFEVINLPDRVPPEKGLGILCNLWSHYRKDHTLLDRYLADWICDYCLIHEIQPSDEFINKYSNILLNIGGFKEFFACVSQNSEEKAVLPYLRFCSNYDYRKSKAYRAGAEQAALFDRYIPRALRQVLDVLDKENQTFASSRMQTSTLTRDSYVGALCSYRIKRKIEVDYCSFSHSHELRFLISDIVKYSENKIRAFLGVRSKLTIYGLPENVRKILDAFFAETILCRGERREVLRPDYEKLYDLPVVELSSERAAQIENASWETTKQLIEAFQEDSDTEKSTNGGFIQPFGDNISRSDIITEDFGASDKATTNTFKLQIKPGILETPGANDTTDLDWLSGLSQYYDAIMALSKGDSAGFLRAASERGKRPDVFTDEINEHACDAMGDVLIEEAPEGGYRIIEEYLDDIKSAFAERK